MYSFALRAENSLGLHPRSPFGDRAYARTTRYAREAKLLIRLMLPLLGAVFRRKRGVEPKRLSPERATHTRRKGAKTVQNQPLSLACVSHLPCKWSYARAGGGGHPAADVFALDVTSPTPRAIGAKIENVRQGKTKSKKWRC